MSATKLLVLTVQFMGLLLHTQVWLVHGVLSQRWLVPSDQRPTQELQIYVSKSPVKLQIGNKNAQKEEGSGHTTTVMKSLLQECNYQIAWSLSILHKSQCVLVMCGSDWSHQLWDNSCGANMWLYIYLWRADKQSVYLRTYSNPVYCSWWEHFLLNQQGASLRKQLQVRSFSCRKEKYCLDHKRYIAFAAWVADWYAEISSCNP